MPVYPGNAPTKIKKVKSASGTSYFSEIQITSHVGTHIDAPSHVSPKAPGLEKLSLDKFYGPCRVLDFTSSKTSVTVTDLKAKNIKSGERILLKTSNSKRGFTKFYNDYVFLSPEGAVFLADLNITLVGIDSLSIKQKGAAENISHTALLLKGIPILEGINLGKIKEGEYTLIAFPLALKGDGAPARAALLSTGPPPQKTAENEGGEVKLFTDGGSRGNPGKSAYAFLICKMDNSVVEKFGSYIGIATNNQAEYQGLLEGLKRLLALGYKKVRVYLDSELVVKQLNGLYKIKNPDLLPLYQSVKQQQQAFTSISFVHVPRALNKIADLEVNRILDEH